MTAIRTFADSWRIPVGIATLTMAAGMAVHDGTSGTLMAPGAVTDQASLVSVTGS